MSFVIFCFLFFMVISFFFLFDLKWTESVSHQDQVLNKCHKYLIKLIPVAQWPLHSNCIDLRVMNSLE